jgi:hypothetical protein
MTLANAGGEDGATTMRGRLRHPQGIHAATGNATIESGLAAFVVISPARGSTARPRKFPAPFGDPESAFF